MAQEVLTDTSGGVVQTTRPAVVRRQSYRLGSLVYSAVGLLETLLAFRFVFLLLGANAANEFVNFIYRLSNVFVSPFYGIFGQINTSVRSFDPATLVAMVVYSIAGWAIVRLIAGIQGQPVDTV